MSHPSSTYSPDFRCPSIGSTANSALSREDAKRLYETSQQRLSQTQDQLKYAMLVRTSSPLSPIDLRRNDIDIANFKNQLAQIQSEMEYYKDQIRSQQDIILRQQVTIKNQSKAIENPRPGREFPGTPRHLNNRGGYGLQQGQAAPPPFDFQGQYSAHMPGQQPMPMYGQIALSNTNSNSTFAPSVAGSWSMYGSSSAGNTPRAKFPPGAINVDPYGSPEKHRSAPPGTPFLHYGTASQVVNQGYGYQTPLHDPFGPVQPNSGPHAPSADNQQYQSWQSFATPDSFISNPYPETSQPITSSHLTASDTASEGRLKDQIQKLFDMAQKYARVHANFPSTAGDNTLPQDIKDRLLNAATPATAFGLMTDQNTRYLLVSKIMLAWTVKHILKFNTFAGLDRDIDEIISGNKATIYQSTPAQLRYLVLTAVAHEVKKLRDRPDFGAYVEHLCQQRATQLLKILRPMMHGRPYNEVQDLVALLREAYKLAELMFTGTDEFSFNFHSYGCLFDGREMVNIDQLMSNVSATKLKEIKASVRLGVTPLVRVRKNTAHGEVKEHVLVIAKVILRRMN